MFITYKCRCTENEQYVKFFFLILFIPRFSRLFALVIWVRKIHISSPFMGKQRLPGQLVFIFVEQFNLQKQNTENPSHYKQD